MLQGQSMWNEHGFLELKFAKKSAHKVSLIDDLIVGIVRFKSN